MFSFQCDLHNYIRNVSFYSVAEEARPITGGKDEENGHKAATINC